MEKAEYCVLDANLSEATLTYIVKLIDEKNPDCTIVFEPVSSQKSLRILRADCLARISILKPNVDELISMCNHIRSLNKERDISRPSSNDHFIYCFNALSEISLEFIKKEVQYLFSKARKSSSGKLQYIITSMGSHGILLARHDQATNKVVFDHFKANKIDKIEDVNGAGIYYIEINLILI